MPDGRKRQGLRDVKKQSWGGSFLLGKAGPTHGRPKDLDRSRHTSWNHQKPLTPQTHKPVSSSSSTMSTEEDTKWLQWVTHQFETIAGEDREIDLQEFKAALNVKEASVHSRSGPCAHSRGAVWFSGTQYLARRERSPPGHPQGF